MLDIESRNGIAIVHMRQEGANRLDDALLRRLRAAFEFVRRSRAVVLTGHGSTFAVGADPDPVRAGDTRRAEERLVAERAAILAVSRHPRPVVAAVNGDALDAGFALAAAADIRIMAKGVIGVTRPVMDHPALTAESCEIISRATGPYAESMLVAGETLTADEAAAMGLVEQACTAVRLLDDALALASELSERSADVKAS